MAKVTKRIKLKIIWWSATPAPPVGSALWQAGVPIGEFINQFNKATEQLKWQLLPVKVEVFDDKSFKFVFSQPAATTLIFEALWIKKWSPKSHIQKIATIKASQLREIAIRKAPDLNAFEQEAQVKVLAWSCRSAWIKVDYDN